MMARSTTRSKQRPDTLMQDRTAGSTKNLLQRTAGPYIRVILDRAGWSCPPFDVGFDHLIVVRTRDDAKGQNLTLDHRYFRTRSIEDKAPCGRHLHHNLFLSEGEREMKCSALWDVRRRPYSSTVSFHN